MNRTRWILCAGMMRSASTVQYQLTQAIVERTGRGRGLWYTTPQDFLRLQEEHRESGELLVLKCHNGMPGVREILRRGEATAMYTYRDLRDVIVSYMRVETEVRGRPVGFWEVVGEGFVDQRIEDDRFWSRLPGAMLQRYEDWTGDLAGEAHRIAEHLGLALDDALARELAEEFSPKSQKERVVDEAYRTMYPGHLGSGEQGQWREVLTPGEVGLLEEWVGDWLLLRGYELGGPETEAAAEAWTSGQIAEHNRRRGRIRARLHHPRRARLLSAADPVEVSPVVAGEPLEAVPEAARSTDGPALPPRWVRGVERPTLGVVMIVKDEEKNLPGLFRTIAEVADEVVVVDTGSSDLTPEVCAQWGVKLVHTRWRDDFSAARNRSIDEATASHLLWLDADDRLPDATQAALAMLRDVHLAQGPAQAYTMEVQNTDRDGAVIDAFRQIRIFPRRKGVRFRNRVHERISGALREQRVELVDSELVVSHTGYSDRATVAEKARRNQGLLLEELKREPNSLHHLVHLAQTQMSIGRPRDADATITEALRFATRESNDLRSELYTLRATYRRAFGNSLAATYDLEQARELSRTWGVPLALLAQIRAEQNEWEQVWQLVEESRTHHFRPGVVSFPLVRHRSNLDLLAGRSVLRRGGSVVEALPHLKAALETDPSYIFARLELGQALLDSESYEQAREVLEPAGEDESALEWFVDISTAIGLARVMTGDEAGAAACLAPLLDLFSLELRGAEDVSPIDLADVLIRSGATRAASNLITLFQKTMASAA